MRIIKYNSIVLPDPDAEHDMPIEARSSLVPLENGSFDQDREKVILSSNKISWRATVIDTGIAIDNTVNAIVKEAAKGRGILTVELRDGGTRWVTYAKLANVRRTTDAENYAYRQPLVITWERDYPYWFSDEDIIFFDTGHNFDTGLYFDGHYEHEHIVSSPHEFTIDNTGTARVVHGELVIEPHAASQVTNFRIDNYANGYAIRHVGSIVEGQRLVIDFATQSADIDGTSDYDNIRIPGDKQVEWMALELGENPITVTGTITGSYSLYWRWMRHYL